MTREQIYDYPSFAGEPLKGAPTYKTMTEAWDGSVTPPAVTTYEVSQGKPNETPRSYKVIFPDGTNIVHHSHNKPGSWDDGLLYEAITYDTQGKPHKQVVTIWEPCESCVYQSARNKQIAEVTGRGQIKAREFEYGPMFNQIVGIRELDYGRTNVLRRTRTEYLNDLNYINRHIFNLPKSVEVYQGSETVPSSRTEYSYDSEPLQDAPGVIQHDGAFNPYRPEYHSIMLISERDPKLAVSGWDRDDPGGGVHHGNVLWLDDSCRPDHPACTWTYRNGMLVNDLDPGLAINAWGGAQHGTELRLHNGCRSDNPDCTWTYHNGMFVSDKDPSLAINAWGGAQDYTVLRLHNECRPENPDCTWRTDWRTNTKYRGNLAKVISDVDAANGRGAITETRRYDIAGNLISTSKSPGEQTAFTYTAATQYAYLTSTTRGAAEPNSEARITTTASYDFNTGLPLSVTDANGLVLEARYSPQSLRVERARRFSSAGQDFETTYAYDDIGLSVTRTTASDGHIASQAVTRLNGLGLVRQQEVLTKAGQPGEDAQWSAAETKYDVLGRPWKQSRPYPAPTNEHVMLLSDKDPKLAINAWDGAKLGKVLRLHNACKSDNPDCTWTYRDRMWISDRDPSLAINAWGGAQHGTELKLANNCRPDNPDCTWTYRNGMWLSDKDVDRI